MTGTLVEARFVGGARRKLRRPIFKHRGAAAEAASKSLKEAKKQDVVRFAAEEQSPTTVILDVLQDPLVETTSREIIPTESGPPILLLPAYAPKLLDISSRRVQSLTRARQSLTGGIIALTAWTIVAAVLYAHSYSGYPSLDDSWAVILFGSTAACPILTALLATKLEKLHPLPSAARAILQKMESTVLLFRVQAMGSHDVDEHAARKQELLVELQSLWKSLTEIGSGVKALEDDFWVDDISPDPTPSVTAPSTSSDESNHYSELPSLYAPKPNHKIALPLAHELEEPTEATPMLARRVDSSEALPKEPEPRCDDGRSPLDGDRYLELRLRTALDEKRKELASATFWHKSLNQTIALLTAGASATALLSLQWTIPIILAVSAAGTSVLNAGSFSSEERKVIVDKLQALEQQYCSEDPEAGGVDAVSWAQSVEAALVG